MPEPTPVAFALPSGPIDARVLDVAIADADAAEIVIHLEIDAPAHRRVLDDRAFHLGPITGGAGRDEFDDAGPVRIEARLDDRFVAGLIEVAGTPASLAQLLGVIGTDSVLVSERSWHALSVTQEVAFDPDAEPDADASLVDAFEHGTLREGYRTMWGADTTGGLPLVASLAEVIESRFEGIEPLPDEPGFRWRLSGADTSWTCMVLVDEAVSCCVVYSFLDGQPTADPSVLHHRLTDLNTALRFGAWQLDERTGSIRFRSSIELPVRTDATALLGRLIERHLDIVDEYAALLLADLHT